MNRGPYGTADARERQHGEHEVYVYQAVARLGVLR